MLDETRVQNASVVRQALPVTQPSEDPASDSIAFVLAMVRSALPDVSSAQDALLRRAFEAPFVERALLMQARRSSELALELRLPAVQQEFALLRRLTSTRQRELRALVYQLAMVDGRIDVFECCLLLLLESSLRDLLEGGEPHGTG